MRIFSAILILLLSALAGHAAVIKTLSETKEGEVVSISDKEVRIKVADQESAIPLADVLLVDFQLGMRGPPENLSFQLVRLTDGTTLKCQEFEMRGKNVDIRLFSGTALHFPANVLHYVLFDAHQEKNRAEFDQLLNKKTTQDVLRLLGRDGMTINSFEGFVGDADEKGENLQFKRGGDTARNIEMKRVRGIVFSRKPDEKMPPPTARLFDNGQNVYALHKLVVTPDTYQLTTPAGVEFGLRTAVVQKIDFSLGKLAYLSDLDPVSVEETPILANLWHFRRDKNLEGGPIMLGRKIYRKGLAVHSRTVLVYNVEGYNFFRAVVGIDDVVTGRAHALVRIEGDDKELFSSPVIGREKPKELNLPIAGVKRLRITVDYGEDFDLGDQVDFAEARVTK